jgi:hypothetical protein
MLLLKSAVEDSLEKYPDFEEFLVPVELALDRKQTPGVRLDASKSVYESIIKTMLGYLDQSKSKNQLNRMSLTDASRRLLYEISRRDNNFNADFIESMTEVVKHFSITRNNTGDISHGHVAPKNNSSESFVNLAIKYVESTCVYLFEVFMELNLSYELPELYDTEENEGFNTYLDNLYDPIGQVVYSKALYELDYDAWIDARDNYHNSGITEEE